MSALSEERLQHGLSNTSRRKRLCPSTLSKKDSVTVSALSGERRCVSARFQKKDSVTLSALSEAFQGRTATPAAKRRPKQAPERGANGHNNRQRQVKQAPTAPERGCISCLSCLSTFRRKTLYQLSQLSQHFSKKDAIDLSSLPKLSGRGTGQGDATRE